MTFKQFIDRFTFRTFQLRMKMSYYHLNISTISTPLTGDDSRCEEYMSGAWGLLVISFSTPPLRELLEQVCE